MAKWVHWRRGWGETLTLSNGLELTVSKDMAGGKFSATVFGMRLKNKYDTIEQAKTSAERVANGLINEARLAMDNIRKEPTERND